MVHGIGEEYIFDTARQKQLYIDCFDKYKAFGNIKLLGYCIMDNHAHFLVVGDILDISSCMYNINQDYARNYNIDKSREGGVFRDRYKSQPINDEAHLANCLGYIHNNPIKSGMCSNASDYLYSSYGEYLNGSGRIDFDEAKKYYDISPVNITKFMNDSQVVDWIECWLWWLEN